MPNIKRLKDLVKVLREVERKNLGFDMGKWAHTGSCGTTCCAAGHHALSKLGQDEGLGLLELSGEAGIIESPEQIQKQRRYSPVFNGKQDTRALVDFYEIDYEQALQLFMSCCYTKNNIRPSHVIERVIEFFPEVGKQTRGKRV